MVMMLVDPDYGQGFDQAFQMIDTVKRPCARCGKKFHYRNLTVREPDTRLFCLPCDEQADAKGER